MCETVSTGLTAWAPVDPRTVTVLSSLWPVTLFLAFAMLKHKLNRGVHSISVLRELHRWSPLTARRRSSGMYAVRSILRQLSLLFVVYFSVYLSLGAVLTTVVLSNLGDAPEFVPRGQFLHYVLSTLVGEFLGRAFMSMLCAVAPGFHFVASPLLAVLPVAQAIFFVISAWYRVIPYLWIYWFLCFIMGTSSGITYVNSVQAITSTAIPTQRYLLLACATAAESAAISVAGLLGLCIEPALQEHCLHSYGNQTCLTRSEDAMFWINGRLQ